MAEESVKLNGRTTPWKNKCRVHLWEEGQGCSQVTWRGGCLGHEGGGSFFVVVELIGHLLLPSSRKSMFRKSMGSGDNGKPHKRWERTFARKSCGPVTHDIFLRLLLIRGKTA